MTELIIHNIVVVSILPSTFLVKRIPTGTCDEHTISYEKTSPYDSSEYSTELHSTELDRTKLN